MFIHLSFLPFFLTCSFLPCPRLSCKTFFPFLLYNLITLTVLFQYHQGYLVIAFVFFFIKVITHRFLSSFLVFSELPFFIRLKVITLLFFFFRCPLFSTVHFCYHLGYHNFLFFLLLFFFYIHSFHHQG